MFKQQGPQSQRLQEGPYGGNPGPGMMYEGSPQIHIKPSAPNTIQYLPNRPPPPKQPRPPPNLDFLQQWTSAGGAGGPPGASGPPNAGRLGQGANNPTGQMPFGSYSNSGGPGSGMNMQMGGLPTSPVGVMYGGGGSAGGKTCFCNISQS